MNGTGVVTALKLEARTLGPARQRPDGLSSLADGTLLIMGGMGHAAAMSAARSLADAGAHALLSFGLAGGLDPALGPGQVVIPRAVIGRDGAKFTASPEWREGLYAAIAAQRPIAAGELLGSAAAIDTVAGKSEAFRDTGAVAVDMESLAVAQVAAARGLPFVAVRVIVDAASDALPRAVVAASLEGRGENRAADRRPRSCACGSGWADPFGAALSRSDSFIGGCGLGGSIDPAVRRRPRRMKVGWRAAGVAAP